MSEKILHNDREKCTVVRILDIISGRWSIPILYMLFQGTHRFSQLQRSIPGINTRMLTKELKNLEQQGMLTRKVYATVPPTVEYSLTEKGKSLEPVLMNLYQWGKEQLG